MASAATYNRWHGRRRYRARGRRRRGTASTASPPSTCSAAWRPEPIRAAERRRSSASCTSRRHRGDSGRRPARSRGRPRAIAWSDRSISSCSIRRPADLRIRVLRAQRLLIDRNRAARIRFEVATRNEFFDLEPMLRDYRAPRAGRHVTDPALVAKKLAAIETALADLRRLAQPDAAEHGPAPAPVRRTHAADRHSGRLGRGVAHRVRKPPRRAEDEPGACSRCSRRPAGSMPPLRDSVTRMVGLSQHPGPRLRRRRPRCRPRRPRAPPGRSRSVCRGDSRALLTSAGSVSGDRDMIRTGDLARDREAHALVERDRASVGGDDVQERRLAARRGSRRTTSSVSRRARPRPC